MTIPNIMCRMGGVLLLLSAGGVSLLHRSLWETVKNGPATAGEAFLVLLAFILASLGGLLLMLGVKVFTKK